jgi:hypothetical protein
MASNDLGPAPVMVGTPAHADDAIRGDVEVRNTKGEVVEAEAKPVAPDQLEEKWQTGRYELWAYYSYYIGNNVSLGFLLVDELRLGIGRDGRMIGGLWLFV